MTTDTETLFYSTRMIIDSNIYGEDSEPRAWLISKVNRISPNGICRITLTQDLFDQHRDYIERDSDGNIIGMWADYYSSNITPTPITPDEPPTTITSKITCSGTSQFKIGGSAKTFTITYIDEDGNPLPDHEVGEWTFSIGGETIPSELLTLTFPEDVNKVKVKFLGDDTYIGKILTVTNTSADATASLEMEIVAL